MSTPLQRMDTFDIIRQIAVDTLNVTEEPLLRATTLNEAGIDSLAAIDLVFAIEGHFGISLSAGELARVRSIQDLAAIVAEHRHDA